MCVCLYACLRMRMYANVYPMNMIMCTYPYTTMSINVSIGISISVAVIVMHRCEKKCDLVCAIDYFNFWTYKHYTL